MEFKPPPDEATAAEEEEEPLVRPKVVMVSEDSNYPHQSLSGAEASPS